MTTLLYPILDLYRWYSSIFSLTNSGLMPRTLHRVSVSNASTSFGVTRRSYVILLPTSILPFLSWIIPRVGYMVWYTIELLEASIL